MKNINSRNRSY